MIRLRKIVLVVALFLACWGMLAPTAPQAATLDAVISVDNIFDFYLGDSTGSNLRNIGHGNNWQSPSPFTGVNLQPGDYIYVAGRDSGGGPQMFLAQFSLPGGTLLTNTSDWYAYWSINANPGDAVLPTAQIQGDIGAATWSTPADLGVNDGSSPTWGNQWTSAISASAHFIWHPDGDATDVNYVLFRSKEAVSFPVPIPSALPLFGSGLLLLGGWRAGRRFF
jgi:hypothetical protein